mmetsp:Transcript_1175/g.2800  ORF Transcript_1175/g.2800 Transcript_1175/m.2800 type:complete len:180 (-) Transcript_1175:1457-1996(-)|eukprot:1160580-Pelagomonas_calceolata.AAC.15
MAFVRNANAMTFVRRYTRDVWAPACLSMSPSHNPQTEIVQGCEAASCRHMLPQRQERYGQAETGVLTRCIAIVHVREPTHETSKLTSCADSQLSCALGNTYSHKHTHIHTHRSLASTDKISLGHTSMTLLASACATLALREGLRLTADAHSNTRIGMKCRCSIRSSSNRYRSTAGAVCP